MKNLLKIFVALFALASMSSCSLATVDGGEEGVFVKKPLFFGRGGVDEEALTEGSAWKVFSTDYIVYSVVNTKYSEKFDDIADGKLTWDKEIDGFYQEFHPQIEKISKLRMEHKIGERMLGVDPKTGEPVSVKIGRVGPVVQLGDSTNDEKPMFASLLKTQSVSTISLEEALKLFELPRTIGEYEGKEMVAAIGKFGPYIRHDGKFVAIPKEFSAQSITEEEAISLIEGKRKEASNKIIKEFDEMPGLQVINGQYGVYLAYKPEGAKKAQNYKLAKDTDGAALTFEEAQNIIKEQSESASSKRAIRKKKKATKTK